MAGELPSRNLRMKFLSIHNFSLLSLDLKVEKKKKKRFFAGSCAPGLLLVEYQLFSLLDYLPLNYTLVFPKLMQVF